MLHLLLHHTFDLLVVVLSSLLLALVCASVSIASVPGSLLRVGILLVIIVVRIALYGLLPVVTHGSVQFSIQSRLW